MFMYTWLRMQLKGVLWRQFELAGIMMASFC